MRVAVVVGVEGALCLNIHELGNVDAAVNFKEAVLTAVAVLEDGHVVKQSRLLLSSAEGKPMLSNEVEDLVLPATWFQQEPSSPTHVIFSSRLKEMAALIRSAWEDRQAKAEADSERILQSIEEDEELRGTIDLFKDQRALEAQQNAMDEETDTEVDDDDEYPEIQADELQDLEELMDTLALEEDADGDMAVGEAEQ
ncbi:hypothetical protein JCM8547_008025 [Rhodosporidiobolus lusitaniae]